MQQSTIAKNYEKFRKRVERGITSGSLVSMVTSDDTYYIEYVLAKGIDIHYVDIIGWTLLFYASAPVIPILLSNGLDVNYVDHYGRTALMTQCYFDAKCELIRNGCDINVIDCHGNTALSLAIEEDNFKLVELLLEKGAISIHTTLHNQITANKLQIGNLTEQSRDLMMYRDFYELCHF